MLISLCMCVSACTKYIYQTIFHAATKTCLSCYIFVRVASVSSTMRRIVSRHLVAACVCMYAYIHVYMCSNECMHVRLRCWNYLSTNTLICWNRVTDLARANYVLCLAKNFEYWVLELYQVLTPLIVNVITAAAAWNVDTAFRDMQHKMCGKLI